MLEAEREGARGVVVEALTSDRYLALLERLEDVGRPELRGDETALRKIWRAEWRRTRKAFARLDEGSADEALHGGRIRVKRARYAAELASHELGRPGARFVAAAKRLQDVLGEHQDAAVAEERIRAWSDGSGSDAAAPLLQREHERKAQLARSGPPRGRSCAGQRRGSGERGSRGRGVPVRQADDGIEVLVVHRAKLRRLDVPKGKCEPGESDEACASGRWPRRRAFAAC